jgi:hypothetical protein
MNIPFQTSETTKGIYIDRSKMLDDMIAASSQGKQEQHAWRFDLNFLTAPAQKFDRLHYHYAFSGLSYLDDEDEDSLDLAARRLGTTRIKTWQAFEVISRSRSLQFDEHQQEDGEQDKNGGDWESMNDDEGFPVIESIKRKECTIGLNDSVDPLGTSVVGTTGTRKKRRSQTYFEKSKMTSRAEN